MEMLLQAPAVRVMVMESMETPSKVCTTVEERVLYATNCTLDAKETEAAYHQQQLQLLKRKKQGMQSTQVECGISWRHRCLRSSTERVKVNCTLEDTLHQASTSGTRSDNAPVYDIIWIN
ncbi:hypothetical protein Tco_0482064 [Tanacetum coccineum]